MNNKKNNVFGNMPQFFTPKNQRSSENRDEVLKIISDIQAARYAEAHMLDIARNARRFNYMLTDGQGFVDSDTPNWVIWEMLNDGRL